MNLKQYIKDKVVNFLGYQKESQNPNSQRLTFISDDELIRQQKQREWKTWYIGDSDELLNLYTNQTVYGFNENPIYNRNNKNFFWSIGSQENGIKRVHSGIAKAIIDVLVNIVGFPQIKSSDENLQYVLEEMIYASDLKNIINQQQLPLTLAVGDGAFKVNFNEETKYPYVMFYDAENVDFFSKDNQIIGVVFQDFYEFKNKKYVLLESRYVLHNTSVIEYELFLLKDKNEIQKVDLSTIPSLKNLKNMKIENCNVLLAVPSRIFYDPLNNARGKSIYANKIDLFDDLDQAVSQHSKTVKVSTPVEYFSPEILERSKDGTPKMPNTYDRQYVQKASITDGDGNRLSKDIETTQPVLYFDQYTVAIRNILNQIYTGIISPATMGQYLSREDNAEAQREKEKITIMTRNNIIDSEEKIIKKLLNIMLMFYEYKTTGGISKTKYDISVRFSEFANPSLEEEMKVLSTVYTQGGMSSRMYVELLYRDTITKEDKEKEIEWLENQRNPQQVDNVDNNELDLNNNNNKQLGNFNNISSEDILTKGEKEYAN